MKKITGIDDDGDDDDDDDDISTTPWSIKTRHPTIVHIFAKH